VTHTLRIRCNYCSRRIPASAVVCPNCHHNPRAFYWKRWHVVVLAVVVLLALAVFFLPFGANVIGSARKGFNPFRSAALGASPTPRATLVPITVIITATPRPPTRTSIPPTTALPNSPPPPTAAPTFSSTPTRIATQNNSVPRATETFTAIPTPIPVPPPKLIAPTDGERIQGANKHVILTFQPAKPIGAQEWYRLQVDYLDRTGQPVSWCAFTKDSALEFPRDLFDDSSPNVRSFLWRVNVVETNQVNPSTCDAPYNVLSAPSEVWTFYWY
jgi:hypothetical protein